MPRLSDHNSGHERIEVLFGAGSGECRLYCTLVVLEHSLSVDCYWKVRLFFFFFKHVMYYLCDYLFLFNVHFSFLLHWLNLLIFSRLILEQKWHPYVSLKFNRMAVTIKLLVFTVQSILKYTFSLIKNLYWILLKKIFWWNCLCLEKIYLMECMRMENLLSLLNLNKRLWFGKDNKVTSLDFIFPLNSRLISKLPAQHHLTY